MTSAARLGGEAPPLLTALVPGTDRVVVRLLGEADIASSPRIAEALSAAAAHGAPLVVVDVAGVRFWDVSGLHALATFTREMATSGRQVQVVGATARTRRLVGLADFTHALRLVAA